MISLMGLSKKINYEYTTIIRYEFKLILISFSTQNLKVIIYDFLVCCLTFSYILNIKFRLTFSILTIILFSTNK